MGARGSPVLYSGERAGRVLDGEPKSLMKQRRDERRQKRKNTHAFQEDELVNLLTGEGPELPKPTPESEPSDDTSKVFQVKAQMISFKQASGCTQESLDPEFVRKLKRSAQKSSLVSEGLEELHF